MKQCAVVVVLTAALLPISGSQLPKPTCGIRNPEGFGMRLPQSGIPKAEYGEFPWMTSVLQKEENFNVYRCGGSLIHPKVILTAAQCVHQLSAAQLMVRAGDWDVATKHEIFDHQNRNVSEIVAHPEFNKEGLHNDIALLFLDTPVTFEDNVQTVCLPPPEANFDAQRCFVSGWGKDAKDGKFQTVLKKAELPIVAADACQNVLGKKFALHSGSICAGGDGQEKGACEGDEGSPLVCPIEGSKWHFHQAGIVSWSVECGENDLPGVYTNVAQYRRWIDQEMEKHQLHISSYTA